MRHAQSRLQIHGSSLDWKRFDSERPEGSSLRPTRRWCSPCFSYSSSRFPTRTGGRPPTKERRASAALCAFVATVLFAATAHAGLLARTRSGTPVRWTQPTIVLVPVTPAPRTGVSAAELRTELEKAVEVWNRLLEWWQAPRLRVGAEMQTALVRQDGVSVVVLQSARWCPAAAREQDDCYDRRRSAITHLYAVDAPGSPRDGEVAEADLEINAVDAHPAGARLRGAGGYSANFKLGSSRRRVRR